jgi:hypothetical protein
MLFSGRLFETFKTKSKLHAMKGGIVMATPIQWETSLTTAKAKAKKEKKLILMDYYNNL